MIARRVPFALLALPVLLVSCRKSEIQSYRVPKETTAPSPEAASAAAPRPANAGAPAAPAAGGSAMASTPVATASGSDLTWTAPAHWTVKPASAMRKGSFAVKVDGAEADLSITAFPGTVGGDLANLNRWRGQVQLPPLAESELESAVQRSERNGLKMTVVDIVGTGASAQRILGAMIPHAGSTWFVKLGPAPDAVVAKEKAAFLAFLDTIKAPPAK